MSELVLENVQRQVIDGGKIAEPLGDPMEGDQGLSHVPIVWPTRTGFAAAATLMHFARKCETAAVRS